MGMMFSMTDSNFALSADDLSALWLTVKLATTATLILLIIGTPLALWLSKKPSKLRSVINALVALPLVLPPTVLGFGTLAFSFTGLVIASVIYSLPFVVQPLQNAFAAIGPRPAEVAATLGAGPWERFIHITLPLARPGFITAAVLGFAHTVGEFGVVLMIGGNIPGETKVASVQIYDHVEALAYSQAHVLSAVLLTFSFIVLLLVYGRKQYKSGANSWQ
jgi:molybdate transport system permease protein